MSFLIISPKNLLSIDLEIRKGITILFQETIDKKVLFFCQNLGFKDVIELRQNEDYQIDKNFSVLCNPYENGDSYALFHVENYKILNLNDCVIDSNYKANEIFQNVGAVDLLLTQFGFASKIGNELDL